MGGSRVRLASAALVALVTAAAPARAAPKRAFAIAAQPLSRALLDFAIQAELSIGVDADAGCRRNSPGLSGRYTASEALDRLLADSGCGYRMIDGSAVRIVRLTPAPPRPQHAAAAPSQHVVAAPPLVKAALEEVVVTATRRGALAIRLPDQVSVVTGDRMNEERDTAIGDLASSTAGMFVTNLGPGSDKVIIRGLSDGGLTGHTQSTVGIYLDDTRMTYNAPDPDLRLADIDQVEVLQGPQGALYGSGSIAGVVHLVTRAPDLERYGGQLTFGASATQYGGPSAFAEGVANIPILTDRLAARIVAYREHDGGYIEDVALKRSGTNTTDRTGVRLALRADLGGGWRADFGLVHQTLASDDSQYASQHFGSYQRGVLTQEPHGNDFDEAHLTLQGDTGVGHFKNTLSVINHRIDTRYSASTALPLFLNAGADLSDQPPQTLPPPNPGDPPAVYDETDRTTAVVDEATLSSIGASRFQWLLGGFVSDAQQGLDSVIDALPSTPHETPVYSEHRTDRIKEVAVYGEASYDITPRLAVGAGARAGITEVETDSLVGAPLTSTSSRFRGRLTNTIWAPKLSLRYQFSDDAMVYVLASEGARSGGFNTSGPIGTVFSGPGGQTEPFRRFDGDELWNIEAGVKARFLADRLDLRATAFYDIWTGIQSDELLPSGLPYTANIGDGRNIGLEFDVAYRLGDFEFRVNGLLDEPELTHNNTPFPSLLHSGLPGVPRGAVAASLHYEHRLADGLRPFFDASVNYVGGSRLTFDSRTTRRMGDYTITRLTTGLDAGAWRLSAFVDNPFDVTGDTFAYGNPFTLRRSHQITPLRPRTAGLQLMRSF